MKTTEKTMYRIEWTGANRTRVNETENRKQAREWFNMCVKTGMLPARIVEIVIKETILIETFRSESHTDES